MKIAFVAYGEKSTKQIPELIKQNWFSINRYADQHNKLVDKTVWSTLLNSSMDIDMLVIITDNFVPYDMLRWAEFCSMHGIKFRLNEGTIKLNLDPYSDYGVAQPKSKRICPKGSNIERLQIQIDPVVLKLMRSSRAWKELVDYYNAYYKAVRAKHEAQSKKQKDYYAARLVYEFSKDDWKTVKRNARLFCLPTAIWELYRMLSDNDKHEVLHNELVPEFTGYREFFRTCWLQRSTNWFMSEMLTSATYTPTGFKDVTELEMFVAYWRPVYDISSELTDIEAATSISYFLLMAIPPELKDIHLQLIPKDNMAVGKCDSYFKNEQ